MKIIKIIIIIIVIIIILILAWFIYNQKISKKSPALPTPISTPKPSPSSTSKISPGLAPKPATSSANLKPAEGPKLPAVQLPAIIPPK